MGWCRPHGTPFILPGVCFHGDSKSLQVANQDHSLRVLESLPGCLRLKAAGGRGISVTEQAVPCFLALLVTSGRA